MKAPIISSKKISLTSDYCYFDLLPIKKHHQCNMRIPQTVLLERGFIKDWVFNSHKVPNHPILKKKKENLSTFSVVKTFCIRNGYAQAIQGCNNIRDVRDRIKEVIKEQKDYDFVKDKKVIQVTTVSNQILVMTLLDFLDYVSQNKYSEQNFYEKWKMIQEKVSFTKIDEYYRVENVRNNHIIESKCQKIISINTTQVTVQSTQIQDDPYKNSSPTRNYQIAQTKNIEGYKFFDTFLNKKFFQMSADLIEFIEKNFKCLVQSVQTRFVINKERQPHLVGIFELEIKPAKKIADMKEFQMAKEKGFVKLEEYERCLQTYIHENMEKYDHYNINTPLSQRRKRCKGKFCKIILQDISLPALLQHKLKLPTLSSTTRVVQLQLRDAVLKRRRRILEKLAEQKILSSSNEIQDQSSEYETQGDEQPSVRQKSRQLKVCQNCFTFYFHVNRFYDLDVYGNLCEKKVVTGGLATTSGDNILERSSQIKALSFMTKDELKKMRSKGKEESNAQLDTLSMAFANEKLQAEQKAQYEQQIKDIKPVTIQKQGNLSQKQHQFIQTQKNKKSKTLLKAQSQPKLPLKYQNKHLSPIKQESSSKAPVNQRSQKKLPSTSTKIKLDPITKSKKQIIQSSIANNYDKKQTKEYRDANQSKGHRLLTLTNLSQPARLYQRDKSKTMRDGLREKRPDNFVQACQQIVKKLAILPDSSRQELIYYAKKYYKDNLPQPIQRRSYSSYTQPHLYQFMSISPVSIHPKRRIKRRPQMSLKRLSQLTDYPQIVSRSQFIFDALILNEQTTIPFSIITTKVVAPDNIRPSAPYQNIFIVGDIFDCFIENISLAKELLEEDQIYNKRIILFNYPGQSHTIYNRGNVDGYGAYFGECLDKLVFRLSTQKGELGILDLAKDSFKFCGFGYGAYLLSMYLGSYSATFGGNINSVLLINPFMQYPKKYKQLLQQLQKLYSSNDPTIESQAHLYYNKAINSQQVSPQDLDHKAGLNPIRVQDRLYLLECALNQHKYSQTTTSFTIEPEWFQNQNKYQVSIVYAKSNVVIPKESALEFIKYRSSKQDIPNRVIVQLQGGHDIMADNYDDVFRVLTLFLRK